MNASPAIASALLLCTLVASPASAMMPAATAVAPSFPMIVNADFVQGHEAVSDIPARQAAMRAETSAVMSQRYLDADLFVTLGALAIASGAFVAVGLAGSRRRVASASALATSPRDGWREEVMQALEIDLMPFSQGLQRAA